MALTLTTEEQEKVNSNRKEEKPTYYSSAFKKDIEISDDYEAFLILADSSTRISMQSLINDSSTFKDENAERDELLEKALDLDESDATGALTEIQATLTQFNTLRDKITIENKFSNITEIGLILSDLQRSIGELTSLQDRLQHASIMGGINRIKVNQDFTTEDDAKQLKSWLNSLQAYNS